MENPLILKESLQKNSINSEKKNEIIVKKRINFLNKISLTKSPHVKLINILKTNKNEKNSDLYNYDSKSNQKMKLPFEVLSKKNSIDYITININNSKTLVSNNSQSELSDYNINFKNNENKKRLLGQIINDFSTNKKINNNIFDDGNQINFNTQDNINTNLDKNINNILIKDETINDENEIKEPEKLNRRLFNTKSIEEIEINNFNLNNRNNTNTTSSNNILSPISATIGNYYKRKKFNGINFKNKDKANSININNTNFELKTPIKKSSNNNIENKSLTKKLLTSNQKLNHDIIIKNMRNRNRPNFKESNSLTSNNLNNDKKYIKNNEYNKKNKKINNSKSKNKNNINNVNNIKNNISINNRYNFYIKMGKNNKTINYEILLSSPYQKKENIQPQVIKKFIVECNTDKMNKNLNTNKNNKKGINVNIKPLYKKVEIEKILLSNSKNKNELNKNIINDKNINQKIRNKTSHSFNKKAFKFLANKGYKSREQSSSFNKNKLKKESKERSLSIKDNKNDINYAKMVKYDNNVLKRPLGLIYYNTAQKDFEDKDNNSKFQKYKNFYKSFKSINIIKRPNNLSYESCGKKLKNNSKNQTTINSIRFKNNNLTSISNRNNKSDNINLTNISTSIINDSESFKNKINDNLNINKNKIKFNSNKKNINIRKRIYSPQNSIPYNKAFNSNINNSFSINRMNTNFNSIRNSYNKKDINLSKSDINTIVQNISLTPITPYNLTSSLINLDILFVLEGKLKSILEKIKKYNRCSKECYEFINYYFSYNFFNEELKIFKEEQNKEIMIKYMKTELLCYFLCYDISFSEDFKQAEILLKSIFSLLYKNFILFLSLVISQYKNKENSIIIILNKIIINNLYDDMKENIDYNNLDENNFIKIIENSSKKIIDYYIMIIENIYINYIKGNDNYIKFQDYIDTFEPKSLEKNKFEILIASFFIDAQKSLSDIYTFDLLKKFFYSFLCFKDNLIPNNPFINIEKNIIKNKKIILDKNKNYFLPKIKSHKYTLILDLDETLIYSQKNYCIKLKNNIANSNINKINVQKKNIILRPGLLEFLHDMKLLYELVIFSSGTPDYVDPIIKIIEKEEKFFDYILYREHITIDESGVSVKDLNLIGRNLKNIIIIDDEPDYFKLQKENGICIRPFYGNIVSDRKTLKTLNTILQKIRFDADETKDIRISLEKYKYLLYPIVINSNELL